MQTKQPNKPKDLKRSPAKISCNCTKEFSTKSLKKLKKHTKTCKIYNDDMYLINMQMDEILGLSQSLEDLYKLKILIDEKINAKAQILTKKNPEDKKKLGFLFKDLRDPKYQSKRGLILHLRW